MFRCRTLWMATLVLCLATSAFAQAVSSLRGKAVDVQGGVLPGVTIQLVNPESGFNRSAVTDDTGSYQFLQVPPGAYDVVSELVGFSTVTSKVTLQVNTPASLEIKLGIANLAEAVTVTAEAALINTVDASVGNAFREEQVRNLPLLTRNVVELLSLQPGVTPTGEVVGARRDQNNITLDGVDVNDNQTAGIDTNGPTAGYNFGGTKREDGFNAALPVPLDSVQEFRVTVAGQNSDQGRSSGGQVTLVTKSGTNSFHGSAYEYNRDTKTAANSWFSSRAGIAKEQLKRNQYGASVGGPIVRNRAFFFGNFERRTDDSGANQLRRVPSATLRQGIIMARANDGRTYELGPAALKAIDPLGIGSSPAILSLLQALPAPNDPSAGVDGGLNFAGYRFNSPLALDNRAYVGKFDLKLDGNSAHNLSVRFSVADAARDDNNNLAQYPGQTAAARLLNNSYGVSASYTAILKPTLVNTASFGLTTIDQQKTGSLETSFGLDSIDLATNYTRPYLRNAPTLNFIDDLNWTKGTHSLTMGTNIRVIRNQRTNYGNAFQSYSFGRGNLLGLGSDIVNATNTYLANLTGNPNIRLSDTTTIGRAFGDLLGVLTNASMTYTYDDSGHAIPVGTPTVRDFASNEFEVYIGDNWRATKNLTLSYGLRYAYLGVPYEQNGQQVASLFPVEDFFAERLALSEQGVPSHAMPHNFMQYDFNGPVNGKQSWFQNDKNNFAPRGGFAYTPEGGLLQMLTGDGGVIRGGAGLVYDRFGSNIVTQFDSSSSFGITEVVRGATPNFTTGARYSGSFPGIAAAPVHTFPFTAPTVDFIGGSYMAIDSNLHAPYAYNANLSVTRPLGRGLTLEAGYLGRWGRDALMQIDVGGWAVQWKDPATGQTWKQMATQIRQAHDAGLDPTNPGAIAPIPFIESMMPGLANLYVPGSATANYYRLIWGMNGGSDADATHAIDRVKSVAFPNCIIKTGCNTLYPSQSSSMSMWTNAGYSNFNGGTFSLRKQFGHGYSFDVNYTLAHAQDNGGSAEAGAGTQGGIMLNPYDFDAFYGDSDFDIRHNLNANVLLDLPFGRGRLFAGNVGDLVDAFIGNWQVSGIFRYNSALPTAVAYGGIWPTHFSVSAVAYPVGTYEDGVTTNQNGNPAIFASTTEAANWRPMYPGEVGTRAAVRLDDYMNTDLAVTKNIRLFRAQRLQFRAEAFNLFNNVNFTNLSLDANSPNSFGQFSATSPARVMQFALRYEF
jgi:hypothetical protein